MQIQNFNFSIISALGKLLEYIFDEDAYCVPAVYLVYEKYFLKLDIPNANICAELSKTSSGKKMLRNFLENKLHIFA